MFKRTRCLSNASLIRVHISAKYGVTWPSPWPLFQNFLRGHVGTSLGACVPNLMFEPLATLELSSLSAFNAQKIRGHVILATPLFREFFSGIMSGLCLGACVPNLNFIPLAILELLPYNGQKFSGSRDHGHAPFCPLLTFRSWGHRGTSLETINRYNRSTDNTREVFQHSHWKCIM